MVFLSDGSFIFAVRLLGRRGLVTAIFATYHEFTKFSKEHIKHKNTCAELKFR